MPTSGGAGDLGVGDGECAEHEVEERRLALCPRRLPGEEATTLSSYTSILGGI